MSDKKNTCHKKNRPLLLQNFIRCGITGWCMEILFTALGSLRRHNFHLMGTTSLWMFPIYGSAALLRPVFKCMRRRPVLLRGSLYMTLIFLVEFLSGNFLKKHRLCPWNYSKSRYNIGQIIRLDYAPCWFGAGLLFEHLLCHTTVTGRNP